MLFDFEYPSSIKLASYDFCVIGAGVAGIAVALRIASAGAKVALLEAGSLEFSQNSQLLYDSESVNLQLWPKSTRLRYFGGTSNHWAGRCRPFEDIDFTQRAFFGLPGWPIRKSEIDLYLDEAKGILDINGESIEANGTISLSQFFENDRYQLSTPTRFKEKYLGDITNSSKIDLFLNANVTNISVNAGNIVSGVEVVNYNSYKTTIFADSYILSCGGLENARLLLVSNSRFKEGLGNHSDFLGRCFMEHLNIGFGTFVPNFEIWSGTKTMQYITSENYVEEHNIGNSNITLRIVDKIRAYGRTRKIKEYLSSLSCNLGFEETLKHWINFKCPGDGAIGTLCEQQPNRKSRVYLSDEVDSLGMKKMIIDWQISESDKRTIRKIAIDIAKEIARTNIGRVRLEDYILDEGLAIPVYHHSHHMGTTRMSKSPEYGVVDPNCKVFNIKNLYIAGSSVFPTGGAANPTMPLLQLALRLADHLV